MLVLFRCLLKLFLPTVLSLGIILERAGTAIDLIGRISSVYILYIVTLGIMGVLSVLLDSGRVGFAHPAGSKKFRNLQNFLLGFNVTMFIELDYALEIQYAHEHWVLFLAKLVFFLGVSVAAEWLARILRYIAPK
jgi:hypothetical protein